MALRELRLEGDPILRKKSRKIENIDDRMRELARDMIETMEHEEGAGLAAVQVGVLRRMITVLIDERPVIMINPEIISEEGEIKDFEGCLSVPGVSGKVIRPEKVRVRFTNLEGKEEEVETSQITARAISHEIDHLNGVLYVDKLEGRLYSNEELKDK